MKQLTAINDPVFKRKESYSALDKIFLRFIRDERDLPFIYLTIKIMLTLLPTGILLYFPMDSWLWMLLAGVYFWLNNFVYKGPFGLMFHCTSHRPLFKKKYGFLNYLHPWIIAPFFGHSPETYYTHHVGMHHAENNLEDDESSTMPFQRDSVRGFMIYFGKFLFTGIYHLAAYFFRKKRKRLLYRSVRGELLFILFCIGMSFISFKATLWVFIIPFFLYRLIAMMGNWAQHAFIDADDPGNDYKNSVTCINTKYNLKCWNDGYHISHHEKQTMHWTDHPRYFQETIEKYIENNAVVFDGIHFLHVFFYLMRKRYDLLSKNFVNIGDRYNSDAEVISFLKSRTRKINFDRGREEKYDTVNAVFEGVGSSSNF